MELFLNFMFISCLQTVLANNKAERLLLNDPALIMERLTQLENTVQQQAGTIQTQAQEIHKLQTAVNSTGDRAPAFFAILMSNIAIGNAEILKFNQVKTNIGGGYDVVTGVFIAPKTGTYHFTSVVYTNGKGDATVQLNKNKDLLVKGYSVGTTHAESHTMNAIVALQRGDHIYVQHRGVSSDAVLDRAPVFFAILMSNIAIGNAEIFKFNQVKTNIDGGYDVVTGVFIAPKTGTYHFTSVVYTNGKGDATVQLNKNKDLLVKGYSVGTTHAESHTMNAIVALQRGDHIYVQHRSVSSDAVLGESHSSYSGFLISE